MNTEELQNYKFYQSLGYVVILASIITILAMQTYKSILKKRNILTTDMDKDKKDNLLAKSGRIMSLIIYSLIYLINEYTTKSKVVIDETLMVGLLTGSTTTLAMAKGIYTSIRQHQKKKNVYVRLQDAEQTILELQQQTITRQGKITLRSKEDIN